MPNRPSLQRGGERERVFLDAVAKGHSVRSAAGVAQVAERTVWRYLGNNPAARNDYELALQQQEAFLLGIVVAAAVNDAKHAEWLLARRLPAAYGDRTALDLAGTVQTHHDVGIIAMIERYAGLSDEELLGELKRLAWVTEQPTIPTSQAPAEASLIMARETPPIGGGTAKGLPGQQPAASDSTADTPENGAEVLNHTNGIEQPLLRAVVAPPPSACPHCRGTVPGRHEADCPAFEVDGRLKAPLTPFAIGGDPR